ERLTGLDVSASANQSPTETLKRLRASGKVEDVGGEEIDDVDTTHYRATVDIDAMAQFGGMSDDLLEQTRGLLGDTYDLDVWVDADGDVARMTWFVDLSASPDLPVGIPDEGDIHYTITTSDFGAPVDVSAPPESQVVHIRDLN